MWKQFAFGGKTIFPSKNVKNELVRRTFVPTYVLTVLKLVVCKTDAFGKPMRENGKFGFFIQDEHYIMKKMAARPPPRDLIRIIINNFINSLRPRQFKGNLVGEDYFGNKYYEIPPNPSIGKRKASRYFVPTDKEAYDQELTAEWEAWLRGRREDPPTREELVKNLSIMEMKRRNAAELDATYAEKDDKGKQLPKERETIGSFPKYDEYEIIPGKEPEKKY